MISDRQSQDDDAMHSEMAMLRTSNRQLDAIVQAVSDGITMQDPSGRLIYANQTAAAMIGYPSPDALLAAPLSEVVEKFELHDEEGNILSTNALPGRRALQGEQSTSMIMRFRVRETGTERWSLVHATPVLDERGEVLAAINIFRDMTARKQAEAESQRLFHLEKRAREQAETAQQQLAFLAEASTVLASSLDYTTTLSSVAQLVVPTLADWCSVTIVEESGEARQLAVAHVNPHRVEWALQLQQKYPPVPNPNAPQGLYKVLRTGEPDLIPFISEEMLAGAAHDEEHLALLRRLELRSSMVVALLARDRILGAITLISAESGRTFTQDDLRLAMDLAHRAATAVDNARLYKEAQQAIQLREQVLSIASHELRTPLTSILGFARLLKRPNALQKMEEERIQRALQTILDQSQRLNQLIDVLLDFTHIQTGRLTITRDPVDLTALTRRIIETIQPTLQKHWVDFTAPPHPLMVAGDGVRLEQVIQNLLDNAIKYSPQGGTVRVEMEQRDGHVALSVSDQGIGIPSHALPHLFTSFYRADNVGAQQIMGLGLGLYVVKESVALHGGTIEVTSEEGQGSTFKVSLPLLPTISAPPPE